MALFRLSQRAEADLLGIGTYSLAAWGEARTARYIDGLEECIRMLADNPSLGRSCDDIRRGLRRMESGQHVVFYREEAGGILVSRILHRRMLPDIHAIEEEDGGL